MISLILLFSHTDYVLKCLALVGPGFDVRQTYTIFHRYLADEGRGMYRELHIAHTSKVAIIGILEIH